MEATGGNGHPGTLTLVSTPIGNLGDITHRALHILGAADVVLAEDTRHSRKLLTHYSITARLESYHDHNKERVTPRIIERLNNGDNVVVISDAGTPGISDPGFYLVRAAIAEGITVTAAPGANAALMALVVSGLPTDRFIFEGFTPKKKGELTRAVDALEKERRTVIYYVAPHQLIKVLEAFRSGLPERELVLGRELTKLHEEVARGTAGELIEKFSSRRIRGEMVLLVRGASKKRKG